MISWQLHPTMVVGWRDPKPPTALLGRPRPHVARAFIRLWLGVDRVRRRGRRTRDCASGSVFGHAHTSRRSSRCERRKHSYSHIFGGLTTRTSSIPQLCPRCSRQLIISGWKHAAPTSSAFLSSCERASTQQKKIDFREQICTQLQKDGYSRERAGHTCTLSCRRECSAYVSDMIV